MQGYTQLTREQRYQIYAYGKAGLNQSETTAPTRIPNKP